MLRILFKSGLYLIALGAIVLLLAWFRQAASQQVPAHYALGQAAALGYASRTAEPSLAEELLPGRQGVVNGHNAQGEKVGGYASADHALHACLWENGKRQDLGALGGKWSIAYHINAKGAVCGDAMTSKHRIHAFVWQQGHMLDLGTLGGINSHAYCINDMGQVVGEADTEDGTSHAFLYTGGRMQDLGTLGGASSVAYGINNRGQVVGYAEDAIHSGSAAFLWQDGRMHDLNGLLRSHSDWKLVEGRQVNEQGEIQAVGECNRELRAFEMIPNL